MDKTKCTGVCIKERQGFALMVTLSALAVIIALTMVLLSYFEEVQHDAAETKALIQADVYYADLATVFKQFKKKETLFSQLYLFPIPLLTPDGRFSLILDCQPLNKGVNINWLGLENKPEMQDAYSIAQTVFDTLAQQYSIEDAGRLQEMLLEEIGGKKEFIQKEYSRLHQKKGIISFKEFAAIVSRYQLEVDDPKVSRIPWEKYFSFSLTAKVIDGEYSSPELLSLLFDIDLQTVQEWYGSLDLEKEKLESFVNKNGGDYAERKKVLADKIFLEESECTVRYAVATEQYSFRFEYIQGEAKYFEFNGKQ